MQLYTIYDSRGEECGDIQIAKTDAVAVRSYRLAVLKSPFKEEFWLYCIGELNQSTMEIQPCKPRRVEVVWQQEEKDGA